MTWVPVSSAGWAPGGEQVGVRASSQTGFAGELLAVFAPGVLAVPGSIVPAGFAPGLLAAFVAGLGTGFLAFLPAFFAVRFPGCAAMGRQAGLTARAPRS